MQVQTDCFHEKTKQMLHPENGRSKLALQVSEHIRWKISDNGTKMCQAEPYLEKLLGFALVFDMPDTLKFQMFKTLVQDVPVRFWQGVAIGKCLQISSATVVKTEPNPELIAVTKLTFSIKSERGRIQSSLEASFKKDSNLSMSSASRSPFSIAWKRPCH